MGVAEFIIDRIVSFFIQTEIPNPKNLDKGNFYWKELKIKETTP